MFQLSDWLSMLSDMIRQQTANVCDLSEIQLLVDKQKVSRY